MKDPRDVIIRPVVSEKSYMLLESNVYTFVVHPDASKPEIHDAIEKIFGVILDFWIPAKLLLLQGIAEFFLLGNF